MIANPDDKWPMFTAYAGTAVGNPHAVTRQFERALCDYTGAKYAVAVNSCTAALFLAMRWHFLYALQPHRNGVEGEPLIWLPAKTYVSVPMQAVHAGFKVRFHPKVWVGSYQLMPYPIWDCARAFTSGMFRRGDFQCVSFHAAKILGVEQGGAILHDSPEADAWLRRARFDGRTEGVAVKDDDIQDLGYHCYMNPSTAAQALLRMHSLPAHNAPLPNDDYPDLRLFRIFW